MTIYRAEVYREEEYPRNLTVFVVAENFANVEFTVNERYKGQKFEIQSICAADKSIDVIHSNMVAEKSNPVTTFQGKNLPYRVKEDTENITAIQLRVARQLKEVKSTVDDLSNFIGAVAGEAERTTEIANRIRNYGNGGRYR